VDDTTPEEGAEPVPPGLFKALYLSIFVLFYRLSAHDSIGGTAFNSVAGITAVQGVLGLNVLLWAEIISGRRGFIEGYILLLLLVWVALYFINSHLLLDRGSGLYFEYEFRSFSKRKRMALLWGATAIVFATTVLFYVSITTYHRVFEIDPYDYF
jgi:hypothetical protein